MGVRELAACLVKFFGTEIPRGWHTVEYPYFFLDGAGFDMPLLVTLGSLFVPLLLVCLGDTAPRALALFSL